ncbi:hypothetical protein PMIN07_002638 [Paraphaeosphaeria minitans]
MSWVHRLSKRGSMASHLHTSLILDNFKDWLSCWTFGDKPSLSLKWLKWSKFFEKTSLHRATMEMFSGRLHTRVVEVIVQVTAQHPDWGSALAGELIRRAKGHVDRM